MWARLPYPFIHPRVDFPALYFTLQSGKGFPFSPGTVTFARAGTATLPSVAQRLACRSPASNAPKRAERGAAEAEGKELQQEEPPGANTRFPSSFPAGKLRSQRPGD